MDEHASWLRTMREFTDKIGWVDAGGLYTVFNLGWTCNRSFAILADITLRSSHAKYVYFWKKNIFRNTTSLFFQVRWAWK